MWCNYVKLSLGINIKKLQTKFVSLRDVKKGDSSTLIKTNYFVYKTSNINKAFSAYSICFIAYFAIPWDWRKWKMKGNLSYLAINNNNNNNNNDNNNKFITYIAQITHGQMRLTYKGILTIKNYMIKIYKISKKLV